MDTLFLHMSPDSGDHVTAWLMSAGGLRALGRDTPAALARRHPDNRCVVFVPADACLFTTVEVSSKQLRQAGSALSWLIEEQVGEDAENLHVVAGLPVSETETPLLAISRSQLEDILLRLRAAGLRVLAAVPDLMLLAGPTGNWQLVAWEDGRVALRTGDLSGIVLEAGLMETMLDAALLELPPQAEGTALTAALPEGALRTRLDAWLAAHPGVTCHFTEPFDPATTMAGIDWLRHPANLLQGRFAVTETFLLPRGLRMAAMFVAVAVAVQLASQWVNAAYYRYQANKLEATAVARFHQLLPDVSLPDKGRMAGIRKHMESHLAGSGSGNSVLPELTRLAESMQGSGLNTQRVDFSGGMLTLDVDARALADIDSLKQRLDAQGFHSEIVSANAQNGVIRGRLRVGGGA